MPTGIKTWLPSDLKKQEQIVSKLIEIYSGHGFEPIEIPTIVDMSVLEKANKKFAGDVFKIVDRDGTTLALRTELTQPIAKTVASRAKELEFPLKLYYNSSIFRYRGIATDDSREIRQIGIESIGDSNNDAEVLKLLLESIDSFGLKDYKVSITDASIWHRIFQLYGNNDAQKAYDLLVSGDLIAFRDFAAGKPLETLLTAKCVEDIEKAFDMDLSALTDLLSLSPNLIFEPLQCPDLNLYTGVHFSLYANGEGKLIALGGRYDNLCREFDLEQPAIGFAFYLPRLMSVLMNEGLLDDSKGKPVRTLKIALSKGTLLEGATKFLKKAGLDVDFSSDKRKLIRKIDSPFEEFDEVELLLVRGHDVPTYVDHGAADLGVVGLDTIIDSGASVIQLEDLNYGQCRLCICAKEGEYKSLADLPSYTRVATTFPNITKDYFAKRGLEVEIINLYGSVELGPLTELSDVIVDLVATGKTLKENGLEILEEIMPCTARLVANRASFKLNKERFLSSLRA